MFACTARLVVVVVGEVGVGGLKCVKASREAPHVTKGRCKECDDARHGLIRQRGEPRFPMLA